MREADNSDRESRIDDAVLEFLEGQRASQEPDLDEFVRHYPDIETEIRQRIASLQRVDSLFKSVRHATAADFQNEAMADDLVGRQVAGFQIVEVIGRGGMGIVYKAQDTRLNRLVAIKTMPAHLLQDETAHARFRREARLLAALNHAHIAVIHDIVEQDDGSCYLILEYVPGRTLAERIADGPLPVKVSLVTSFQIAEALAAAYEKDIIHRDLKPGNIKITPTGEAKVLDFGIAKALGRTSEVNKTSVTQAGHLVGTPAYMSPEQVRGKAIDHRADIWAFGCVLYEMLTGLLAFEGETISDTIASVLDREPDWTRLPSDVPANIRVLLRRCLEKNVGDRLQHIGDAAVEIRETVNPPAVAPPLDAITAPDLRSTRRWIATAFCIIGFVLGGLTVALIVSVRSGEPPSQDLSQPPRRMVINLPEKHTIASARMMPFGELQTTLAISPDGSRIVYAAAGDNTVQLYLRAMDDFVSRPIPGTEGGFAPFFSPDSQSVGFFTRGKLRTISLRGGQPVTLCDASQPKGACWGSDSMIYFAEAEGGRLSRIPRTGGRPEHLAARTEPSAQDSYTYGHPQLLPDGEHLLLSSRTSVLLFSLADRGKRVLIEKGQHARYIPTGHVLYTWAGAIQAVPFDLKSARVIGSPTIVLDGILLDSVLGTTQVSVSDNGTLVYVPGGDTVKSVPVWIDRTGQTQPLGLPAAVYGTFRLSPDGRRLCIQRKDGTLDDIYIWDLVDHRLTRLTRDGCSGCPIWTPDGKRIVFSGREEPRIIAWLSLDAADDVETLYTSRHFGAPYSWSPDGRLLAFVDYDPNTDQDIWILPVEKRGPPHAIVNTPSLEWGPAFSPDGHWIAYVSDRAGDYRVYVQPYPALDALWVVSDGLGEEPIWSPRGDELYYRKGDKWMAVSISTAPEFSAGAPHELFEGPYVNVPGTSYDVSPDGSRFVVLRPEHDDSAIHQINVVLNWFDELRGLGGQGDAGIQE